MNNTKRKMFEQYIGSAHLSLGLDTLKQIVYTFVYTETQNGLDGAVLGIGKRGLVDPTQLTKKQMVKLARLIHAHVPLV